MNFFEHWILFECTDKKALNSIWIKWEKTLNFIWMQRNECERQNTDFSWNPSWIKFNFIFLYILKSFIFLFYFELSHLKWNLELPASIYQLCYNLWSYKMNDLDNNNPMEKYLIKWILMIEKKTIWIWCMTIWLSYIIDMKIWFWRFNNLITSYLLLPKLYKCLIL